MSIVSIIAFALTACAAPYAHVGTTTIEFPVGSNELSVEESRQLAEVLKPLVGNPLVEVDLTAFFPYGDGESSPAYRLAKSRTDRLKSHSAEVGVSLDLVGAGVSAVGWTYEGGQYQPVPYPADKIDSVDVTFRIKSECHPLVDLARRLDPY